MSLQIPERPADNCLKEVETSSNTGGDVLTTVKTPLVDALRSYFVKELKVA